MVIATDFCKCFWAKCNVDGSPLIHKLVFNRPECISLYSSASVPCRCEGTGEHSFFYLVREKAAACTHVTFPISIPWMFQHPRFDCAQLRSCIVCAGCIECWLVADISVLRATGKAFKHLNGTQSKRYITIEKSIHQKTHRFAKLYHFEMTKCFKHETFIYQTKAAHFVVPFMASCVVKSFRCSSHSPNEQRREK